MRRIARLLALILVLSSLACRTDAPHPRSDAPYHPPHLVEWVWNGGVTENSAVVTARLTAAVENPKLLISTDLDGEPLQRLSPVSYDPSFRIARFEIGDLQPATTYYHQVVSDVARERFRVGQFRTFATRPASLVVAFGACAETGSTGRVFDTIREHDPDLFLHLGDFHYQNLRGTEVFEYIDALSHVLASPAQSALYRNLATAYLWDDHDYGPDNSDRTHPGRSASRRAYQLAVPHYPLGAGPGDTPVYQSFTIGPVHFLLTDGRSERDPNRGDGEDTLLGSAQKGWFKQELLDASTWADLVVWVNTVPWIDSSRWSDGWGGYAQERQELAEFMAENDLAPMIMLAGDAHMLAIDDGSHSQFAEGQPPIPVFHAAALDRPGSEKGGPYSHGTFPGGGQFGLMEIGFDSNQLNISWSGRDYADREIVSHSFRIPRSSP